MHKNPVGNASHQNSYFQFTQIISNSKKLPGLDFDVIIILLILTITAIIENEQ